MIPPPESYEGDCAALQYRAAYRAAADRLDRLKSSDASVAEVDAERERMRGEPGAVAPERVRLGVEDAIAGRDPRWRQAMLRRATQRRNVVTCFYPAGFF